MKFNKYSMISLLVTLFTTPVLADGGATKFKVSLDDVASYKSMARIDGNLEFVKYTYDFGDSPQGLFFQNTGMYEWHFPFLVENIPHLKNMSNNDYQEWIGFNNPASKKLTAGGAFLVQGLTVPGVNGPRFLGISVYYPRDLDEYVQVYEKVKTAAGAADGNVVIVFEDQRDYFKYFRGLQGKGIPAINFKVIADRGNIIEGGEDREDGRDNADGDESAAEGTFSYKTHNHMWNSFTATAGGTTVSVSTPEGDDQDVRRNITFGFRPKVVYNQFTVKTSDATISKSVWEEDLAEGANKLIFCRNVPNLQAAQGGQFPLTMAQVAAEFGVTAPAEDDACNITIPKPSLRPGPFGSDEVPTDDVLCVFEPQKQTGSGPALAVLHIPFVYDPEATGWVKEKAADEGTLCVDGQLSKVKLRQ